MPNPPPAPAARAVQRERAREQRKAQEQQDQDLFEIIACGYSYEEVAKQMDVSVATLRRRVDRAIARRKLDPPHKYMHLQVARLNKALKIANFAVERTDIKGIELMMKLVDRLDRYHGLAGLPHRATPATPRERTAALATPQAPFALGHAIPQLAISGPEFSE